jgi:hypothetical protein
LSFNLNGITRILGFAMVAKRSGAIGKPSDTVCHGEVLILQLAAGSACAIGIAKNCPATNPMRAITIWEFLIVRIVVS